MNGSSREFRAQHESHAGIERRLIEIQTPLMVSRFSPFFHTRVTRFVATRVRLIKGGFGLRQQVEAGSGGKEEGVS